MIIYYFYIVILQYGDISIRRVLKILAINKTPSEWVDKKGLEQNLEELQHLKRQAKEEKPIKTTGK